MHSHKRAFAVGLFVFSFGHLAAAAVGFHPAVSYPVGTTPVAVASGDFNSDGKPDLAVVNAGKGDSDIGSVSILLGNGDGTFQPAINITAGKNPESIAVGDFNGDDRPDLAVGNAGDGGGVSVLLGNGDGTFQSVKTFSVAGGVFSLALGDFDGDLRPDLVVLRVPSSANVTVFLGKGDGKFGAGEDVLTGISVGFNLGVLAADFDGDRKVDLAVSGGGATLLGNGDGTFQPGLELGDFSAAPTGVGDFNRDGKLDLVIDATRIQGESFGLSVNVLLGNGDGSFQAARDVLKLNDSKFFVKLSTAMGDFNGDMKPDLIVTQFSSQSGVGKRTVDVYLGNGDGTFQPPVSSDTNAYPSWVSVADLNADHAPDLVTANQDDNTVSVLLNSTGADFSISASPLSPGNIGRGQSSTSTVTLSHQNTFDNPVELSCSVQPTQSAPTCSIVPSSVIFDANGNGTAVLAIGAGASTASLVSSSWGFDSRPLQFLWLPVAGFALMGRGLRCRGSKSKELMRVVLAALLLSGLIFQAACGDDSSGPRSQTYTVTITGTSQSTQHSTTVPLTVQ